MYEDWGIIMEIESLPSRQSGEGETVQECQPFSWSLDTDPATRHSSPE